MKKPTFIILTLALLAGIVTFVCSVTNKLAHPSPQESADLKNAIGRYMRGEPVSPTDFPWNDIQNPGRVNTDILAAHRQRDQITEEEFQAFLKYRSYWMRPKE